MPLDINLFRVDRGGNPDLIRESQRRRFKPPELVDEILAKDAERRSLVNERDTLRKERNSVQDQVSKKMKAKEPCDDLKKQIKEYDGKIVAADEAAKVADREVQVLVNKIGNIVDDSVPVSKDEEKDTEVVRTWGTPTRGEALLNHHNLLWQLGGYEPERGVSVAGHRAYFLRDAGVLLNQALINYGIAFLRKRQYSILQPPYFMNKDVMAGVAQLEQFDEELYKVTGDDDKYLIATSEQPICGFHKGEWLKESDLPLRYCGVSTCFRKEAGSHGRDTWGIFRVHQFEKVEQFVLCDGDLEVSKAMQEEMIKSAEEFYQSLNIAYRVVNIVSGELNNAAIKKYDLEGWFPGYDSYRELVSCSNCTDYQARAMEIRCGVKKMGQDTKKYVHMLNSTLCATTRTICAILENNQTAEGVRVPEVLVPFMGGITFLPFVREPRDDKGAPGSSGAAKAGSAPKAAKPKPAPKAPATAAPSSSSSSGAGGPGDALAQAITAKGEEIRQLKTSKADKATLQPHIDQLLALKKQYKDATGKDYGAAPAPAPATTTAKAAPSAPAPAPAPALDPKAQAIADAITAKGEEIRKLKGSKADKATLQPHIDALLGLKQQFKELTGSDFGQPPAPSKTKQPATTSAAPKGAPTKDKGKAAPAPPKAPTKAAAPVATPPPASILKTKKVPVVSGPLIADNKPNLAALDAHLYPRSYIKGFTPSQEDVKVWELVSGTGGGDLTKYPHLARWAKHVATFSPSERASWS